MTLRSPHETTVRSEADLLQVWRDLMGPGGFGRRSLWLIFIGGSGQLSPVVVPIDDLPAEPDELFTGNLALVLRQTVEDPVSTAALLLSRPGPAAMTDSDRRWARALRAAISPAVVPWPMHLATADRVRVFAPDDLVIA